jgi:CRISPR-associated protein Csb1
MPDDDKTLIDQFLKHDRVVIEASLELANGSFFQPTGFPDIGACVFIDKDGRRRCLVESEQSMANRLEAVCMQPPGTWRAPFNGKLPIIRVIDGPGSLLATNLTEPHRVSSSYVLEGTLVGDKDKDKDKDTNTTLQEVLQEQLGISKNGKRWPLDKRAKLNSVVFALDPAAVLHGFQFMQWSAVGLRQQRLLHARMEAVLAGDSDVHYGMVKVDAIEPDGHKPKSNMGQSIAQKARLVHESITATFEIDLLGLRERQLISTSDEDASKDQGTSQDDSVKFLLALALWKIRQFLADQPAFDARTGQVERSLRLRSDCALRCTKVVYRTQSNGGSFDNEQPIAFNELVKIEKEESKPLVNPPDFKPLLKAVTGQESLEINVRYPPTSRPTTEGSQTSPSAQSPDDAGGEGNDSDADE